MTPPPRHQSAAGASIAAADSPVLSQIAELTGDTSRPELATAVADLLCTPATYHDLSPAEPAARLR